MMHMRIIANLPGDMARDILKFLQESDGRTFEDLDKIALGPEVAGEMDAGKAETLHNNLGCAGCHSTDDSTLVGPGYREIAKRYDMDEETFAELVDALRTGSSGKWGPHEMPPNPSLSKEEAELLVRWIMSLE